MTTPDSAKSENAVEAKVPEVVVAQQHSMIIYWWPVWTLGFLFALMSFTMGHQIVIDDQSMWFYPGRNVGVIFVVVSGIVFLITNVAFRGMAALVGALATLALVLLLSVLGWWDVLFSLERHLSIHMDGGFYLIVATFIFCCWCLTIFIFDRLHYCEFRPGQLIVRNLVGGGSRTFDTRGMAVYKLQDDPLRHWLLGFGTGDLHIATTGAESIALNVRNVAFIDRKLDKIKELIALAPDTETDS